MQTHFPRFARASNGPDSSCAFALHRRVRQPFASFTISTVTYTAVLDRLTDETFILVLTKPSIRQSKAPRRFPVRFVPCSRERCADTTCPSQSRPRSSSTSSSRGRISASSSRSGLPNEASPVSPHRMGRERVWFTLASVVRVGGEPSEKGRLGGGGRTRGWLEPNYCCHYYMCILGRAVV